MTGDGMSRSSEAAGALGIEENADVSVLCGDDGELTLLRVLLEVR